MTRFLTRFVLPVALLVAIAIAPLVSGARTLFLRDVLNSHLMLRTQLAASLRAGELALIDPLRAGGQGLLGNLNAVPLYPDNLLLFVSSTLWQLNAHFWLHWLAAFGAMFALARVWGLGRESAWAAAILYGFSGYLLSQMNLYNAVAGAALAPALAAALLASAEERRRWPMAAAFGGLWALELLAGDPVLAVLALGVAVALGLATPRRIPWTVLLLALGAGTLIAAPQIVETMRLLPGSFRGFWGNTADVQGKATPGPLALIDLLLPFFFGRPDLLQVWGNAYFGGVPPLYFSLAPGLLALAAVRAGWRGADRKTVIALVVGAGGAAIAFSGGLAGTLFSHLPGGGLFRFSVKFFVATAIALALVGGRGIERAFAERDERRLLLRALGILIAVEATLALLFLVGGNLLEPPFRSLFGRGLDAGTWGELRFGWGALALLQVAVGLVAAGLVRGARSIGGWACAALLVVHGASQLLFLRPMLPTDEASLYRSRPALLDHVPESAVLAHGGAHTGFDTRYPAGGVFPDRRLFWLSRRAQQELFGFSALAAGRRMEFLVSPEGLDAFTTQAIAQAMDRFDDRERLAVLQAAGVDLLVSPRPIDLAALDGARLEARIEGADPLFVYRIEPTLGDAQLLGAARFAPHVQAGLAAVFGRGFDPRRVAVIAGEGETRSAPQGTVRIERFAAERIELRAESAAGGFVVVRRAWLPIWQVEVDGVAAEPRIANLTRLAVELPPGRHRVRFFISRTPLRLALLAALCGVVGLVVLSRRR